MDNQIHVPIFVIKTFNYELLYDAIITEYHVLLLKIDMDPKAVSVFANLKTQAIIKHFPTTLG